MVQILCKDFHEQKTFTLGLVFYLNLMLKSFATYAILSRVLALLSILVYNCTLNIQMG